MQLRQNLPHLMLQRFRRGDDDVALGNGGLEVLGVVVALIGLPQFIGDLGHRGPRDPMLLHQGFEALDLVVLDPGNAEFLDRKSVV